MEELIGDECERLMISKHVQHSDKVKSSKHNNDVITSTAVNRRKRSKSVKRVRRISRTERLSRSKSIKDRKKNLLQLSHSEQYEQGFAHGYAEGVRNGQEQYGSGLDGTSIIIPTYNKLDLLKVCIESIQTHTMNNYEIIVVDNASTDGTEAYLQSMTGKLRFHVHEANRGFSGAVNTGLMMAKGNTICLLNNDILVTPRWLSNLLHCLHSDGNIGIVGPVTNYISGDQQIAVPYKSIEQMWKFAGKHNHSNAAQWEYTDRIVGFCYLFRRSLFEEVGYFDEGFEIGNFEDEDYIVRVRLNGRKLIIARDTFIHHFGSQSMKELGSRFSEVNDQNASYFSVKWGNPYDWLYKMRTRTVNERGDTVVHFRSQHLYPSHVAATGLSEAIYWIENGIKYPLQGPVNWPVIRLSQIDLLGYPTGPVMNSKLAESVWKQQTAADGSIPDGGVFKTETGLYYQRQGATFREIMSLHALNQWKLANRAVLRTEQERLQLDEGLPIMAAPIIHSYHI